jgi:hypothetical protein
MNLTKLWKAWRERRRIRRLIARSRRISTANYLQIKKEVRELVRDAKERGKL